MEKYALHTGISDRFTDLLDTKIYKKQAEDALAFSNEDQHPVSYFYEEVMLRIILNQSVQRFDANFYHPALKVLAQVDAAQGTFHGKTLKRYVLSDFNMNEAAEALSIHRNTLAYRLTKIKELTSLDLEDKETKLLLLMNYYA